MSNYSYANDTVLISISPDNLQEMLQSFETYCDNWCLNVNVKTIKIIVF